MKGASMKLSAALLCASVLSGSLNALPPLAETKPPFEKSETAAARTSRYFPGKGICRFRGDAVQVLCYRNGTPQFHFVKPDDRFGGLAVSVDGKPVGGIRREAGNSVCYDFPGGGKLSVSLLPDGRIQFESSFPNAEKLRLDFYLRGGYFGGTETLIDGRRYAIPVYSGKPEGSSQNLFRGKGRIVRFCNGMPERSFGIEFPEDQAVALVHSPKGKAVFLQITPANSAEPFRFVLDPGVRAGTAQPPPPERITKAAGCDLWELDRYALPDRSGRNLLQNSSFEQGFRYLIFRHRGKQNFDIFDRKPVTISSKEAKFGSHSLAIFSTPDKLLHQPVSTHSVLAEAGSYTVSLYAKTDAPGRQTLTVQMMDPAFIWNGAKWPTVRIPLTGEWKRYTLTHNWKSPIAFPIVLSASSDVPATCYIDGLQLEKGTGATPYEPPLAEGALCTSAPDNFVEFGKPVNAYLDIMTKPGARGTVTVKVRDFFDTEKFRNRYSFEADAAGKARVDLPLDGLPRGIFIVETDYRIGGKKRYEIQRFSIMSFLDNSHKHRNLFVNTYVDPLFPMQIYRDVLERYRKLGYGARAGFANNDRKLAELAGRYGVESAVCRLAHASKNEKGERDVVIMKNVEWYLVPGMNRKNALLAENLNRKGPLSAEFLKQVENAAAEIARNSPSVRGWYFLCEPEGTLPEWANPAYAKPEDFRNFIELETAAAKGIRRGNPDARLYTSTTSNISGNDRMLFYDRLLAETGKRGVRYDGICAHNYRVGAPEYPVSMETEYRNLFAVLDKHGYSKAPVYSPEGMHWLPLRCRRSSFISDYPVSSGHLNGLAPYTYDLSYAEKIGSAYRARTWLIGLKHQDRIKLMNASNYGTFEMDAMLTPFAFQKIPNTLGRLLGNARFLEELNLFPNTRCYLFEDEQKRPVAVLWACMEEVDFGEAPAPDLFFRPPAGLELFDLMEAEHSVRTGKDGLFRLPLSPYPVFLRGTAGSVKEVAAMLRAGYGKSNIPQRPPLTVRLASPDSVSVTLTNPESSSLDGRLESRSGSRSVSIPPDAQEQFRFPLALPLSARAQNEFDLIFRFRKRNGKEQVFRYDRSFSGLLAMRSRTPFRIDGDLSDWNGYPAIPMRKRFRGKRLQRLGQFPGDRDFSAKYRIAWDENGLYLAVEVTDDKFGYAPRPRIRDGWKNDSLQLFFDTFADGRDNDRKRTPGPDDWSYGIFPKDSAGRAFDVYRFLAPDVQLTRGVAGAKADTLADDVRVAFRRTADGYCYEIAFSPKSLEPFQLKKNKVLGIGILLNDVDDPTEQEPRSRLVNTAGSEMPNDCPGSWPLVLLAE